MNNIKPFLYSFAAAILLFIIISAAYMAPALEGKNLRQSDMVQHKGMSKELVDYREETGKEALWTNSMFGGMPAYLISTRYTSNLLRGFHRLFVLGDWRPICFVFLYLFGAYIALLAFGVNRWLSIAGAIAYAFSSYFFVIIEVGHISKVLALGYMPPIIGGVHMAFRGKYLVGGLLLGVFLSLQMLVVHLQITYYTMLIVLLYGLFELIGVIRERKQYRNFLLATTTLLVAALLAVASNFSNLWTTYEYGNYSIRGKSELTHNTDNQTSGLDKDYATQWSYGIAETFTLLIPDFHGGSSASPIPVKSSTYEFLKEIQGPATAKKTIKQMPTYWGTQPFTLGPVYAGAIVVFLFVLGFFLLKGPMKWWILSVTLLSVVLAWGKNFSGFTNFFLDHVPGYNKFRTVSMILVMAEFALPFMGILAVNEILKNGIERKKLVKAVLNSFYISGGLCLFFIFTAPMFFSFEADIDQRYIAQGMTDFVNALQSDRLMMLRKDAFRSLVFILLAAGLLLLYIQEKLTKTYLIAGLGLLILVDMWPVNKRYLNADDFVAKREYNNPITKTAADEFIERDTDPGYRVLNLSLNPFMDATTSYFHKSIGGYHGAKMRRYQELIDFSIQGEIQQLIGTLQKGSMQLADSAMRSNNALNMLNTRYIIYNAEANPIINRYAAGNAWFVSDIRWVADADEEISALPGTDISKVALVDERYRSVLPEIALKPDTGYTEISLQSYAPNHLVYHTESSEDKFAVFSEIYYPKGWEVTIDGVNTEHVRANYVLRAMFIPAGNHTIEFSFEPASFYMGNKIAWAGSGIMILLLVTVIVIELRKAMKTETN
jgi:hypothetical protein